MQKNEIRQYANLIAYPLIILILVQSVNTFIPLGKLLTLIEIFTYAFIGLYATKRFKLDYTNTVIIATSLSLVYYFFVESLFFVTGHGFEITPIIYQMVYAMITSFIVAFITKRYMVDK